MYNFIPGLTLLCIRTIWMFVCLIRGKYHIVLFTWSRDFSKRLKQAAFIEIHKLDLEECYEIVNEALPLSGLFHTDADLSCKREESNTFWSEFERYFGLLENTSITVLLLLTGLYYGWIPMIKVSSYSTIQPMFL